MDTTRIARVAYDARRSYLLTQGEPQAADWFRLDGWQRTAMVHQVKTIVVNAGIDCAAMHALFLRERRDEGWEYGPRLDLKLKRDPLMVPWEHLTRIQRKCDELVIAVVDAFRKEAV